MTEPSAFIFQAPEWHDALSSTNTVLRERVEGGECLDSGFVLAVLEQTRGRGRYDRPWESGAGRDLTFSFLYRGEQDPARLPSLPMAAALGVSAFLESAGLGPSLKWPNDVRVRRRKIAGILAERATVPGASCIVVGIGLNVNMTRRQAAGIDQAATSLHIETGREHDVQHVLDRLLPHLHDWIVAWEESGFDGLRAAWLARCDLVGQCIEVKEGDAGVQGILDDFGPDGELLLRLDNGRIKPVWSGDVTG